ncbi:MAG: TIGR03790 family protein [Desulfatiglandales bacterium]
MCTKTVRYNSFGRLTFFLILMCFSLIIASSVVFALSPGDLVIVFNLNMPESKAVADYYAKRRGVPTTNCVGVDVTVSERMLRSDFERRLIPPVLAVVERLKDEGRDPAILLVYGIPLGVKDPVGIKPDKTFMAFTEGKVREYRDLAVQMIEELDHLIGENGSTAAQPKRLTEPPSPEDVLKMAGDSLHRGMQYLKESQTSEDKKEKLLRVSSLLIRLAGTSPAAKAFVGKMLKEEEKDRGLSQGQELLKWNAILKSELLEGSFWGILPEKALETATTVRFIHGIVGELKFWDEVKRMYGEDKTSASVDSELTLMVAGPYQHAQWLPNPFHASYDHLPFIRRVRAKSLMVGRLDGPTPESAKRLVDDAVATERVGLRGVFYIDARGLTDSDATNSLYSGYDQHLFNLYHILKDRSSMEVVIDKGPELFPVGACPQAALYCGWYSLGNYVDSFKWERGSIGFHVASAEASTLRARESNVWCKRMIEEGVAATLGPVEEPYLLSFPLPDHFFPLLMSGKAPLLEVYFRTTPYISWRQILIGDPLYIPFKKNPALPLPEEKKTKSPSEIEGTGATSPPPFH